MYTWDRDIGYSRYQTAAHVRRARRRERERTGRYMRRVYIPSEGKQQSGFLFCFFCFFARPVSGICNVRHEKHVPKPLRRVARPSLYVFSPPLCCPPPPPVPSLPLDSLSSSREIASITIVKGSHVFKRSCRLAVLVCYYKGEGDKLVKGGEEGDETGRGALRAPRRGSRPFDHPLFFALREEIVL